MRTICFVICLILATISSGLSLAEDVTMTAENPDLEGIWILEMEDLQVTMVVHQFDCDLAGACTGNDPEPWNAVMVGSVSGNEVEFHAGSVQNGVIVIMAMTGGEDDGTITGSFVQADSLGNVANGNFTGFIINPDTSEYEPAFAILPVVPSTIAMESITTPEMGDENMEMDEADETSPKLVSDAEESRFLDVTTQTERVFFLGWAWKPD